MIPLYKFMFELPVGLANPIVLIDNKSIFELLVGLANPVVLIDSKSIFELPTGGSCKPYGSY